jgi:hypothetical protein
MTTLSTEDILAPIPPHSQEVKLPLGVPPLPREILEDHRRIIRMQIEASPQFELSLPLHLRRSVQPPQTTEDWNLRMNMVDRVDFKYPKPTLPDKIPPRQINGADYYDRVQSTSYISIPKGKALRVLYYDDNSDSFEIVDGPLPSKEDIEWEVKELTKEVNHSQWGNLTLDDCECPHCSTLTANGIRYPLQILSQDGIDEFIQDFHRLF